jgi:hypothetical protein
MVTTFLALSLEAATVPEGEFVMPSTAATDAPVVAVRVDGGVGLGSNALAAQASIEAEYWVHPNIAFGLHAGTFNNSGIFGRQDVVYGAGPAVSLRSSASRSYALVTGNAGLAVLRESNHPLCLHLCWEGPCNSASTPCPGAWEKVSHVPNLGLGIGWMAHPGVLEIGPLVRLDVAGSSVIGTLNLVLGLTN